MGSNLHSGYMKTVRAPLYLTRSDPSRNMARFYALSLEPTLFGELSLVRNWGRIGTKGQIRIETFSQTKSATAAFEHLHIAKLKKGYRAKE